MTISHPNAPSRNPYTATLAAVGSVATILGIVLLIVGAVVVNAAGATVGARFDDIAKGSAFLQWGVFAGGVGVTALLVLTGVAAIRWVPKPPSTVSRASWLDDSPASGGAPAQRSGPA